MAFVFFMSLGRSTRIQLRVAALEPAHMRQGPFRAAADSNQFSRDGYGNLFWRNRSNVQAYGCVYPLEQLRRNAFLRQFAEYRNRLALGANHADIPRRGLHCPTQ